MGNVTIYLPDSIDFFFYSESVKEGVSKPKFCQSILFEWMKRQNPNDKAIIDRLQYYEEQLALNPSDQLRSTIITDLKQWKGKAKREITKQDIQRVLDKADPPSENVNAKGNLRFNAEDEITKFRKDQEASK